MQDNLPAFPPVFTDGFENGLGNWTAGAGSPTTSAAQKHSGSYSYMMDEEREYIQRDLGANYNKVAVVWMYDNASDTSAESVIFSDDAVTNIMLGIDATTSTTRYVYRLGNTYYTTSINRSTGWHKFAFDYTSGTQVRLYIDGTQVATSNLATSVRRIILGDLWQENIQMTTYYDDISIQDTLP